MGELRYGPQGRGIDPYQWKLFEEQMERLKAEIEGLRKKSKAPPEKRTGQNGPPLELPADRLNPNELKLIKAMPAEGTSTLTALAEACFPADVQANSKVRNSLRRLIRGAWLEKEGRGKYKLTALGRSRAQGL